MSEPRLLSRTTSLIGRFRSDSKANVAVIFGIAIIPIMSAIGSAVDYSLAARVKAKLQSAADAAAVAAISQNSLGWKAASLMTSDGEVTVAEQDAANVFNGNVNVSGVNGSLKTNTVTKTGVKLTSTLKFTADVPLVFMKIFAKAIGFSSITVTGNSSAASSLPAYLDFYVALDVSGSMGLPSTTAEATRMQNISPDNIVQYPTGCTFACHFAQPPLAQLKTSACIDPAPNTPPNAGAVTQKYPTGNYCLGYQISRVSQSAYAALLTNHGGKLPAYKYTGVTTPPAQVAQPTAFYSVSPAFPKDPILSPVSSCPTAGTDNCIQLRLDAVGVALNATKTANGVDGLFATALDPVNQKVPNQYRIGLYPFIRFMNTNYSPLTSNFNASPNSPGTINFAAANLAALLDTNTDAVLGSGGTHIDQALHDLNGAITAVGSGNSSNNTQPYVFLITDGAQDPQIKGVPNGSWSGSNHATVLGNTTTNTFPTACTDLKNRGIIISVLNIPYQPISPVNASFAGDEDDAANNNIPNIPKSLQTCASPPDASGTSYYYEATSPDQITAALKAMFNHALVTAHITN